MDQNPINKIIERSQYMWWICLHRKNASLDVLDTTRKAIEGGRDEVLVGKGSGVKAEEGPGRGEGVRSKGGRKKEPASMRVRQPHTTREERRRTERNRRRKRRAEGRIRGGIGDKRRGLKVLKVWRSIRDPCQ